MKRLLFPSALAFFLNACLGSDPIEAPSEENLSVDSASALSLLEDFSDTVALSESQKQAARQLRTSSGHDRTGFTTLDIDSIETGSLTLSLFPGTTITMDFGMFSDTTHADSIRILDGITSGDPGALVQFVFKNGELLSGSVTIGATSYSLVPIGGDIVMLFEFKDDWFDCGFTDEHAKKNYRGCQAITIVDIF